MTEHHKQQLSKYLGAHKARQNGTGSGKPDTKTKTGNSSANLLLIQSSRDSSKTDVPVMFSSSVRSRTNYLNTRRKAPIKIVGKACINHLPDEILLQIFSHLGAGDLLMSARVCKRWLPLATDNLLWNKIYEQYGKLESQRRACTAEREVNYKTLCMKQCKESRNKRMMKLLTKLSPFTGLPRDTDKALKAGGVYYQLCFIDRHDNEHLMTSRETFYHPMATCVRWYDLDPPVLRSMTRVKVYAVNPLFFKPTGTAISNSPYQRSLLLSVEFDWTKWVRTTKPLGSDDMVHLYSLPSGLLIATWKGDGGLAFVCLGLHNNKLVTRCLRGTVQEPYDMGAHKVIPDDITTSYGLIDYKCTVEIRTLRNSIWSQQFNSLFCKKESIGYAVFPLIRRDCVVDQVILQKKLDFPWKTDAFRGIVENVVWVDVTVLDERGEKFWCIRGGFAADMLANPDKRRNFSCSATKINGQRLEDNLSFDYTNQDVFVMSFMDERGKIEANMKQSSHCVPLVEDDLLCRCLYYSNAFERILCCFAVLLFVDVSMSSAADLFERGISTDDGDFFVTNLELKLSLDAINQWFGTAYS